MGKDGKLGNCEIPMIFVGYALDHSQDCYCMYNPNTQQIHITRDITWLHHVYYTKLDVGTSAELVVTHVLSSISADWEGEQEKLLPHGNTEDESFPEDNTDGMLDANEDSFQPVLPTTRAGRVHTRPTKL